MVGKQGKIWGAYTFFISFDTLEVIIHYRTFAVNKSEVNKNDLLECSKEAVQFSSIAVTNYYKIDGLKQQKFSLSQFERPEIQDQSFSKIGFWRGLSSWLERGALLTMCLRDLFVCTQ